MTALEVIAVAIRETESSVIALETKINVAIREPESPDKSSYERNLFKS